MEKLLTLKQRNDEYVELVQLTDTHIFSSKEKKFDDINTLESLKKVISHIQGQQFSLDTILMTGDLVHEPVEEAYQILFESIEDFNEPIVCLAGNHDAPELMQKFLNKKNVSTVKIISFEYWQVLMLNSFLTDTHSGKLDSEELIFIEQQLQTKQDLFTLICLHHPPVNIGSPWMDAMALENPEELFSILDKYENVKGILWGHIHQEFMLSRNNVLLMASPSTCVQFKPKSSEYEKDKLPPGYRQLKLFNSGEINTEVIRI